jgi:autoinducer 2 (AI-2) kinase
MAGVLRHFVNSARKDAALIAFASKQKVTTHYLLGDLGLEFYLGFIQGGVIGDLGAPPQPAEVRMKAKAEVLDSILTGRLNGNQAALTGKLSFTGDVRIAMGVQKIQADLVRLYTQARAEAGGLDFTHSLVAPAPPAPEGVGHTMRATGAIPETGGTPESAGDLRHEIVLTVNELYANGLITATGGNVSARIPESNELYITPSQLFKGGLRPEMMVRVDLQGVAIDPDAPAQSSEQLLHCEVYRARPDVQAIIHAHPPHATILMLSGLPFLPITTEAAFLYDIPRVKFIMPGSKDLASAVTKALGKGAAVFMQNHGIVAVGSSLRHAANLVEVIESTCQLIVGCYAAGKAPPTLPKDVVKALQAIGRTVA